MVVICSEKGWMVTSLMSCDADDGRCSSSCAPATNECLGDVLDSRDRRRPLIRDETFTSAWCAGLRRSTSLSSRGVMVRLRIMSVVIVAGAPAATG